MDHREANSKYTIDGLGRRKDSEANGRVVNETLAIVGGHLSFPEDSIAKIYYCLSSSSSADYYLTT